MNVLQMKDKTTVPLPEHLQKYLQKVDSELALKLDRRLNSLGGAKMMTLAPICGIQILPYGHTSSVLMLFFLYFFFPFSSSSPSLRASPSFFPDVLHHNIALRPPGGYRKW